MNQENKEYLWNELQNWNEAEQVFKAIKEAKKEVFDDIEKDKRLCITSIDMWNDLKKRHLV